MSLDCIEGCLEWGQARRDVTNISMPVEINRPRHQPSVKEASELLPDTRKTISDYMCSHSTSHGKRLLVTWPLPKDTNNILLFFFSFKSGSEYFSVSILQPVRKAKPICLSWKRWSTFITSIFWSLFLHMYKLWGSPYAHLWSACLA